MVELVIGQLSVTVATDDDRVSVVSAAGNVMLFQTARIGLTADNTPRFMGAEAAVVLLKAVIFIEMVSRHESTPYVGAMIS
jgi:hypothetical protein